MKIKECTVEDIVYILEHPWDITRQELENFGLLQKHSHEELAELLMEHNFGHCRILTDMNDIPIAAVGMAISTSTDWVCWSIRSELFPDYYRHVTAAFKNLLSEHGELQRKLDGTFERIILITSVDSPGVERWCKTIGFKKTNGDGIKELYDCDVGVYVKEFY